MKNAIAFLLLAFTIIGVVGCEKTADFTTDETAKLSLEAMKEDLSDAEAAKLDRAVLTLMITQGDIMKDPAGVAQAGKELMHGMTASEIIAKAEKYQAQADGVDRLLKLGE